MESRRANTLPGVSELRDSASRRTGSGTGSSVRFRLGYARVHARLPGQAQDALADDVALDFVGPARQPVARGAEHVLGPREAVRLPAVRGDPRAEQGAGHLRDAHEVRRGDQLADGRGGSPAAAARATRAVVAARSWVRT